MLSDSRTFPPRWGTYGICLLAGILIILDSVGLPRALAFISVPAAVVIIITLLVSLVRLSGDIKKHGWKGVLPVLICVITIPSSEMVGHKMLELRFTFFKNKYEAIAEKIHSGAYILPLKTEDLELGLRAEKIDGKSGVSAVGFMAVSHGFAGGHAQYLRFYDDEYEKNFEKSGDMERWGSIIPLGARWYLLQD